MKRIIQLFIVVIFGFILCLFSSCREKSVKPDNNKTSNNVQKSVGLYAAPINTANGIKWGYIDKTGEFVIKPVYDSAGEFNDICLAVVSNGGQYGVIGTDGNYIIKPKYDYIDGFYEGLAIASGKDGYTVIDQNGKVLFISKGYIGCFHEERAVFEGENDQGKSLYGYIDKDGKVVVEPRYETSGNFKNGKAVVKMNGGGYAIIGKRGEVLETFGYYYIGDTGETLYTFKEKRNGKFGFINDKGNVVIEPQFSNAEPFEDERAVVNTSDDCTRNKYGLIDKRGKAVIKPKYNDIKVLGEGMYAIGITIDRNYSSKGSVYAVADKDGKILTDFSYYGISNFKNGIASAYDNNSTFFINKYGTKVEGLYDISGLGRLDLEGDLIRAEVDNRISYYDKSGNSVWKQNGFIVLNRRYTVKEVKYRFNRNYIVYYPQINGMENETMQIGVNSKLKDMAIVPKPENGQESDYTYRGDFGTEYFYKDLFVLKLTGYNYPFGAAHGIPTMVYAHIDLHTGRFYHLWDLFYKNSNYVELLNNIIRKQIEKQGKDSQVWLDSYKGIKPDQAFIITHNALKIYFDPYEIAPYSAGFPMFTIPYDEIEDIINTQGELWNSFN